MSGFPEPSSETSARALSTVHGFSTDATEAGTSGVNDGGDKETKLYELADSYSTSDDDLDEGLSSVFGRAGLRG